MLDQDTLAVLATEDRQADVRGAIRQTAAEGSAGYTVVATPSDVGWYDGNYLRIDSPADACSRALPEWIATFERELTPPAGPHPIESLAHRLIRVSLADADPDPARWADPVGSLPAELRAWMADAEALGFDVMHDGFTYAPSAPAARSLPAGYRLVIRPAIDPTDAGYHRFAVDALRGERWFSSEAEIVAHVERQRRTSDALGTAWYCAEPEDAPGTVVARVGLFAMDRPGGAGRIGRLQAVDTAPDHRRQGIAAALVSRAMLDAEAVHGCTGIACAINAGDDPFHYLYRPLGFEPKLRVLALLRYPRSDGPDS